MTIRSACLLMLALVLSAQERTLRIEPAEGARIRLTVEKTRLLSGKRHDFTWSRYTGSLRFDPARPAASAAELVIDSDSLKCHDTWVSDTDLRKIEEFARKDMLGIPKHSQIQFRSHRIEQSAGGYKVTGQLTFRDNSKPVVLDVTLSPAGGTLWIDGRAEIRLTDYGLKPPTAALGTIGTRDEMAFEFHVLATESEPARP